MDLKTEMRKKKTFDIVIRKYSEEGYVPIESRTIKFYGEADRSIDDVVTWVKKELSIEEDE